MRFRVKGQIYEVDELVEIDEDLLAEWNRNRETIYCLCKGTDTKNLPRMHIAKSIKGKLFIKGNASNIGKDRTHEYTCMNNPHGYYSYLSEKGIVMENGEIKIHLRSRPRLQSTNRSANNEATVHDGFSDLDRDLDGPTQRKTTLRMLLLTLLQESNIHYYRPYGRRNIPSRIYRCLFKTTVNKKPLNTITYLANDRFKMNARHEFIIAWGLKEETVEVENMPFLYEIPLYSLANTRQLVDKVKVSKHLYNQVLRSERAKVAQGYWIIQRKRQEFSGDRVGSYLKVVNLSFIPAEEFSRIPVESSYEEQMIQYLITQNRTFQKPLIGNVTELFLDLRPDMVLEDTNPKTIIEVAGMKEKSYRKRLLEKKQAYQEKGYRYLQWDGDVPLKTLEL